MPRGRAERKATLQQIVLRCTANCSSWEPVGKFEDLVNKITAKDSKHYRQKSAVIPMHSSENNDQFFCKLLAEFYDALDELALSSQTNFSDSHSIYLNRLKVQSSYQGVSFVQDHIVCHFQGSFLILLIHNSSE